MMLFVYIAIDQNLSFNERSKLSCLAKAQNLSLPYLASSLISLKLLERAYMLLYWGMFTAGFTIGAIFAFMTFAPKKPGEEDAEYESFARPKASNGPSTFVLINKGKQPEEERQQILNAPQTTVQES